MIVEWNKGAQYWDKPWNPVIGCEPISPACENCYAKAIATRFNMTGCEFTGGDFHPTFKKRVKNPPRKGVVFCGNMTDLFGTWVEECDSQDWIHKTLGYSDRVTYLWLTKRPDRMCKALNGTQFIPSDDTDCLLWLDECEMCNQFFGFTAENQEWYDKRFNVWKEDFPKWANGWVSVEPLLGPIDLHLGYGVPDDSKVPFKWIVVGCESGPKRRPCKIEWVESIVQQAMDNGIKVFVKQLDIGGKCVTDITKFPEHLQIRQVPWVE